MSFYPLPSPPPSQTSSPALSIAMLKSRLTPDSDDACMPTSQVFDSHGFDSQNDPLELEDPPQNLQPAPTQTAQKRSSSPAQPAAKKPRPSTKDFVPPDVSGLSKREARLVKNRAAAFLSRQRKREEFENMEVRVAQLEKENARLLALTSSASASSEPDSFLRSEIENLRAQLAAAQAREQQLLAMQSPPNQVKIEPEDPPLQIYDRSPKSPSLNTSPNKSAASFGLMVLLCALPSLLSVPNTTMPTTFAIPSSISTSSSSFDFSTFLPNDFDWARPITNPSFDIDNPYSTPSLTPASSSSSTRKLEFDDTDASSGLAGLDVSFNTCPTPDGKIRVKIHRPATSTTCSYTPLSPESTTHPSPESPLSDPFLGVTAPDSSPTAPITTCPADINYDINYDLGSEYTISTQLGVRKRVRIALMSPPASGGEGGEWEVELR